MIHSSRLRQGHQWSHISFFILVRSISFEKSPAKSKCSPNTVHCYNSHALDQKNCESERHFHQHDFQAFCKRELMINRVRMDGFMDKIPIISKFLRRSSAKCPMEKCCNRWLYESEFIACCNGWILRNLIEVMTYPPEGIFIISEDFLQFCIWRKEKLRNEFKFEIRTKITRQLHFRKELLSYGP